ncbi:hypothetical protein PP178_13835 [Zeaxanthinibacter sp. PT1]|uniref:hypothetical protein n=1 Tax=Zeaxanthinibacter TaxID=561554 RepID=UPI00234927D6|nr:hypothetical protein [Zeaxanthinibacter sp. PT1]MDC6352638.1 hypothetical protein [Zeaxanthinibacter sp. PT1]
MKKFQNKLLGSILAGIVLVFAACEDSNEIVDQVTSGTTRGVVLRTLNVLSNEVAIQSDGTIAPGASFGVELEYQDHEDGDLLAEVEVYVGYRDNTAGGTDNDKAQVLAATLPASSFSTGDRGLPVISYTISGDEMLSALGLPSSEVEGGDQFEIRFEAVLTDGRRFSFADNSGTITGSYFNSPFLYTANVVCAPSKPTAGVWSLAMQDSYGDGWNGAAVLITIDGETTAYSLDSIGEAVAGVATFTVGAADEVISVQYQSGDWDSEVTFQLTSANGNTVVDAGPSPSSGVELLDYCPDNL